MDNDSNHIKRVLALFDNRGPGGFVMLDPVQADIVVAALTPVEEGPPVDWLRECFDAAVKGETMTKTRMLEMFADLDNWRKVYADQRNYWAWCGPNIPPYEMPERKLGKGSDR